MIAQFDTNNILYTGPFELLLVAKGGGRTVVAPYPSYGPGLFYVKSGVADIAASSVERSGDPDEIFLETTDGRLFVLKIPRPVYDQFPMKRSDWTEL